MIDQDASGIRRVELFFILLLAVFGGWVGHHGYHTVYKGVDGVSAVFLPSLMFASGQGMIIPEPLPEAVTEAFWKDQQGHFDPSRLPAPAHNSGEHLFRSRSQAFPQTRWVLYYALGWSWRLFGINHSAVAMLASVLSSLVAVGLYLLFRLGMNGFFAAVGALTVLCMPGHLSTVSEPLAFAKGPLILFFLVIGGTMLRKKHSPDRLRHFALLFGLLSGIGSGFHAYGLLCFPVALLLFFITPIINGYALKQRGQAAGLFVIVFLVCSLPVLQGFRHNSGIIPAHPLIQGLSRTVEQNMHFGNSDYNLLLTPRAPEVHAVINAHARRRGIVEPMDRYRNVAYKQAGHALFIEWARTFPADLFSRTLASTYGATRLAALSQDNPINTQLMQSKIFKYLVPAHDAYIRYVERLGVFWMSLALIILSIGSRSRVVSVLMLLWYFTAVPSLFFELRHAFHLAFVVPWAVLFVIEQFIRITGRWCGSVHSPGISQDTQPIITAPRHALYQTVLLFLVLLITISSIVLVLRRVQKNAVMRIVASSHLSDLTPVDTKTYLEGHEVLVTPNNSLPGLESVWNLPLGETAVSYLALSFAPSNFAVPIRIAYTADNGADLTHTLIVPSSQSSTRFYMPVYALANLAPADYVSARRRLADAPVTTFLLHEIGVTRFRGIRIAKEDASFFQGMSYVEAEHALPWLLHLRLPEHAEEFKWRKYTPLDKALATLPIEARHLLHGNARNTVNDYFHLANQYPNQHASHRRLLTLINALPNGEFKSASLYRLGRMAPPLSNLAASRLTDLVYALAEQGNYVAAESACRWAAHLAPNEGHHETALGDALLLHGAFSEALEHFMAVLHDIPESPYSALRANELFVRLDKLALKTDFWRTLRTQHPDAAVPAIHWGNILEEEGKNAKALSLFNKVVKHHPDNPELLLRRGIAEAIVDGHTKGRVSMDKALEHAPHLKPRFVAGLARIAEHYLETGAYAFAEAIYREAIDYAPDDTRLKIKYGEVLASQGEQEAALGLFMDIFVQAAPKSSRLAQKIDNILVHLNDQERRVQVWSKLASTVPYAGGPRYYLGLALEAQGRLEEAAAAFHFAANTTSPYKDDAVKRLERLANGASETAP